MTAYFITGTDTGVGKTLVACALLHAANQHGLSSLGLKPVAAGCEQGAEGWVNEDALALQQSASVPLAYQQLNPVALPEAIAPHIAAARAGKQLQVERIAGYCRGALQTKADFYVIEGAGGWRVPLNPREYFSDLAKALNLPVVLVVGLRLGCLNHAVLTAEAIQRDGLQVAGWVANVLDPDMPALSENIDTLRGSLPCPMLGEIPRLADTEISKLAAQAAAYLHIEPLVPAL